METGAAFVLLLLWANRCLLGIFLCCLPPLPNLASKREVGAAGGWTGGLWWPGAPGAVGWGVTVSPPAWDSQDVVLGLASPSGLRHVCHEAVRWSTQWFVDTQPSWTHCILRGSCWPPGAGGWLGKLALAPILWQDLEGEDSDPFGPWFLPRA